MNIIGIIPARMGSSRFPGKPIAKICGISMLEHVYRRCKMSKTLNSVYVATCDQEIKEVVEGFGGQVIMTRSDHERASDRVAEALLKAEKMLSRKVDVVVMIQGDEPMIFPEMIDLGVAPLKNRENLVTNLMAPLRSLEEFNDPNQVKVVVDKNNNALYFSREPIPSVKKAGKEKIPMLKQVCIISFQRDFLIEFNALPQMPLEKIESVDMMRVLESGYKVNMVYTDYATYSVDTMEDLKKVEALMPQDPLAKKYLEGIKK